MKLQANIISQSYYKPSGASLLTMMQNKDMPILDLFVREVFQNSLDAASIGNYVKVNISIGSFSNISLANKYEIIDEILIKKYGNNSYTFLAVSDYNTIGLIGSKNGIFSGEGKNENLAKLVYHIMKPQPQEGSGGSTGVGKTIYYRIGNGLVIYYSRIKISHGIYEERLVSSLIEDEKELNSILNSTGTENSGIALFGLNDDDKTSVVVDPFQIKSILDIFGIKPYIDNETGTTVIIPYTDEQKLLSNNLPEDQTNKGIFWITNIKKFLNMSIVRWYFPRMNANYKGSRLKAYINEEEVIIDDKKPVFSHLDKMYSSLLKKDIIDNFKIEKINGPKYIDKELGHLVYRVFNDDELKLTNPSNYPHPNAFVGLGKGDSNYNSPIILYARKPGMIISYETGDGWNNNAVTLPQGKHLLAFFVLNSNAKFYETGRSLEEYIRQSEKSDHTSWIDHSFYGERKRQIVATVKSEVSRLLKIEIEGNKEEDHQLTPNAYFSKKYAQMLLPKSRFGTGSSIKTRAKVESGNKVRGKHKVVFNGIQLNEKNKLILDLDVKELKKGESVIVEPIINTSEKKYNFESWIEAGLEIPLKLDYYSFHILNSIPELETKMYLGQSKELSIDNKVNFSIKTIDNITVGIEITNLDLEKITTKVFLEFCVLNNSYEVDFKYISKESIDGLI